MSFTERRRAFSLMSILDYYYGYCCMSILELASVLLTVV